MSDILLLYGDESQLIEDKKKAFLHPFKGLLIMQYTDETEPSKISAALSEESLFGEKKVFILANLPLFKKSNRNVAPEWEELGNLLASYVGDNPVLITYHANIDKRIKQNTVLLKSIKSEECKSLSKDEMKLWMTKYCKSNGFTLTQDGQFYMASLIDLWDRVPLSFLQTEFDRLFLQLGEQKTIDSKFLQEYATDYGNKNIFTFKDALLNKDVKTLMELFPFMLSYKEINSAMAYIENQLRLQLMVSECRATGMRQNEIVSLFQEMESSVKAYPIKLAYEKSKDIKIADLSNLLYGLYKIMSNNRQGKSDMLQFRDLCLAYCE